MIHPISNTLILVLSFWAASIQALPEDTQQEIRIASDKAFLDKPKGELVYTGNVRLNQGTLKIEADKVTIIRDETGLKQVVAEGKPARYEQVLNKDQEKTKAYGETIIYITESKQLTLLNNAGLQKQGNEFSGERIVYLIDQQKVKAESPQEDQRIRMVIQPEKQKDSSEGNKE